MKNLAEMYSFSSKLWYDKRWISKSGEASLYLQVYLQGRHKEFPLKLRWPVDSIDMVKGELLPRVKKDPEVDDYNLLIRMEQSRHTEILRTYRIKKARIDLKIFAQELQTFDQKESFASYMCNKAIYRRQTRDITERTYLNHMSAINYMLKFDSAWSFEKLEQKFIQRFRNFMKAEKADPGYIWTTVKTIKTYLRLASKEPLITVNPEALDIPNPMPKWKTTYLTTDEVRRLLILHRDGGYDGSKRQVLSAFLFTCFTSLRISDVYRVNAKWRLTDGFLDFIPKKNERFHKWVHIPIMPIATKFIPTTAGLYFDLPSEKEYNLLLKDIAYDAEIRKRLTSHVGRHTFGYLYMTTVGNLKGLQEIMGHSKIETTMRYAHLDDEYLTESIVKMQQGFKDLVRLKAV